MPTLTPSSEDVRIYEIAVLYPTDLSGKEEAQLLKDVEGMFAEADGKQLFKDQWSRRGLAYRIEGRDEAKFLILYYELDPAKIRGIDMTLRLEKNVMRHLIVIPPAGYEAVSYEDRYKDWMKNRETASEMRAREKEEKVKERMKAKAKMEARRQEAQKKKKSADAPAGKSMEKEKIAEELDKLISDEDLNM